MSVKIILKLSLLLKGALIEKESQKLSNIPIASICASAILLAKAGILNGRKFTCLQNAYENHKSLFERSIYTGTDIEVENTVVTAKGTAFAEFAVAICQLMGLLNEKEKLDSTVRRAFSEGYKVTLIQGAHSTFNSEQLRAADIIQHHNKVLGWFANIVDVKDIKLT